MQRTLLKYTLSITGAVLALLALHLRYGSDIAAVPVSVVFYGWLAYLLLRWGARLVQSHMKSKTYECQTKQAETK